VNYLIISSSLDPNSRSRLLAHAAHDKMRAAGVDPRWLDTADLSLPLCDGETVWAHADVELLEREIANADGILIAMGIYNFGPSAIAKTLVELAGPAWTEKVVAFACAAGGATGYMGAMPLANSLMLDYRAVIVPRFVYATSKAFGDHEIVDEDITVRIGQLIKDLVRMTEALRGSESTRPV